MEVFLNARAAHSFLVLLGEEEGRALDTASSEPRTSVQLNADFVVKCISVYCGRVGTILALVTVRLHEVVCAFLELLPPVLEFLGGLLHQRVLLLQEVVFALLIHLLELVAGRDGLDVPPLLETIHSPCPDILGLPVTEKPGFVSRSSLLKWRMKTDTYLETSQVDTQSQAPSDLSTGARTPTEHAAVVAEHYNTLQEKGLEERSKSRIFYLRNFNNWIKSMLINEYLRKAGEGHSHGQPLRVLDMGCGKGGDLLKWRRGSITHLICADLAETSVEQCQTRYNDLKGRSRHERAFAPVFSAEFITADCTKVVCTHILVKSAKVLVWAAGITVKIPNSLLMRRRVARGVDSSIGNHVRLREKYKDVTLQLDLVSCQFVFHYSFESLPQAECMLRNASETLRPGGFFIGTIPDACEIVSRAKKAGGRSFGNDLYRVEFEHDPCTRRVPLFGAKYGFHLEGVVDCPEFLVHFPTLERLAEKFGLELVFKKSFKDYYLQCKEEGRSLLGKMQALEVTTQWDWPEAKTYPPFHDSPLLSKNLDDYEHAQQYMQRSTGHRKVGTLSRAEWEAACE
uniref:mRNA (guanine-N(7))-methyltransferase n=1 Tax=Timema cristinae TaxID=61476 RepID=A0A7R9CW61_TIMCR|nr:unnamed protein product [Timema cristinae]